MKKNLISRRGVLAGTAAAGLYGLTGPRTCAAEVNWKKYAGTTLEAFAKFVRSQAAGGEATPLRSKLVPNSGVGISGGVLGACRSDAASAVVFTSGEL